MLTDYIQHHVVNKNVIRISLKFKDLTLGHVQLVVTVGCHQDTLPGSACDSAVSSVATMISTDSCICMSFNTYCTYRGLNSVLHSHVYLLGWTTAPLSWGVTHLMPIDNLQIPEAWLTKNALMMDFQMLIPTCYDKNLMRYWMVLSWCCLSALGLFRSC